MTNVPAPAAGDTAHAEVLTKSEVGQVDAKPLVADYVKELEQRVVPPSGACAAGPYSSAYHGLLKVQNDTLAVLVAQLDWCQRSSLPPTSATACGMPPAAAASGACIPEPDAVQARLDAVYGSVADLRSSLGKAVEASLAKQLPDYLDSTESKIQLLTDKCDKKRRESNDFVRSGPFEEALLGHSADVKDLVVGLTAELRNDLSESRLKHVESAFVKLADTFNNKFSNLKADVDDRLEWLKAVIDRR